MLSLAARSVIRNRSTSIATGVVAITGVALVSAMMALFNTGLSATVPSEFLTTFPLIVGGWIVAIVVFAMASTVSVTLQGRAQEFTGIRLIGAEPRQIRGLIVAEATMVSLAAAIPGLGLGYALAAILYATMRGGGAISADTLYSPGFLLPIAGVALVLVATLVAGFLSSRRPASGSVLGDEPRPRNVMRAKRLGRLITAGVIIVAGLASSLSTLAFTADDVLTTAMTGPGCVLLAVGVCLLAPELTVVTTSILRGATGVRTAPAWLAARNLHATPQRVRPLITFLTLFVGIAAGTLGMQGIEDSTEARAADGELIASINYLVVGLLATFMAVALVNNLIAAILRRRPEFVVMRLVGATPRQTGTMLLSETVAAAVVSIVAGSAGAIVSTLPYVWVKTGSLTAAFTPWLYLAVAATGMVLVLIVTLASLRRTVPGLGRRSTAHA
ncbi:MAG: FtsX-like permease family protein [Microbacterium sp.]|jgi:putative ABC transport system permease protein|nr:FtsX-like permease family protein [Microbacterium sp.]